MTPEEYRAEQAAITAGLSLYVSRFAGLFTGPSLSYREWLDLLGLLFPEVQRRYLESADLGRRFFDYQRAIHHPELPRKDMLLSQPRFDWFVQNMEPARRDMMRGDSPRSAVSKLALTAVREVEMAGRRQVIGAVKNDTELSDALAAVRESTAQLPQNQQQEAVEEPVRRESQVVYDLKKKIAEEAGRETPSTTKTVQGWARVATGNETCAWCLMLISRGPEYLGAANAGLRLHDTDAVDLFREAGEDFERFRRETKEYIEQWHVGCDCLVVPVFDTEDWPGLAAQRRAEELWIDASKEASRLIKSGDARTDNHNKETINALRRRLDRGEINMSNYAVAA